MKTLSTPLLWLPFASHTVGDGRRSICGDFPCPRRGFMPRKRVVEDVFESVVGVWVPSASGHHRINGLLHGTGSLESPLNGSDVFRSGRAGNVTVGACVQSHPRVAEDGVLDLMLSSDECSAKSVLRRAREQNASRLTSSSVACISLGRCRRPRHDPPLPNHLRPQERPPGAGMSRSRAWHCTF